MVTLMPSDPRFQEIHASIGGDPTFLSEREMRAKLRELCVEPTSSLGKHALAGGPLYDGAGNHFRLATANNAAASKAIASKADQPTADDFGDMAANLICGPERQAANTTATAAAPTATPAAAPTGPRRISCEDAVASRAALPLSRAAFADAVADLVEQRVFGRILERQAAG